MRRRKLTKAMIDAFAPEHTVLRYHNEIVCSDTNRIGGFRTEFEDKEWRCKRCCLLDIRDGIAPEDVRIDLEVRNAGNVIGS